MPNKTCTCSKQQRPSKLSNQQFTVAEKQAAPTNEYTKQQRPPKLSNQQFTVTEKQDPPTDEVILDPFCDPDHPVQISFQDVTSASFVIRNGIQNTPCKKTILSNLHDMDIYLKMEFQQVTGSFKERGARNTLSKLTPEQKKTGVITASLGNHALGVCYHACQLGIPATVVMPVLAPIIKIQRCRNYNATVVVEGHDMGQAKTIAMRMGKEQNLPYINGYDHPDIISGQGTIGLEICEQVDAPDAVVVPVGGGGLLAGIAVAMKGLSPLTQIIGVESERCPGFSHALEHGAPCYTPVRSTLADGLAVPVVGYNSFATIKPLLDKMIVVKEEWIAMAILRLVEVEKCVVEGAGASGLAAILSGQLDEFKGKKVVLVCSGGNIDTTLLSKCFERGLVAEGRLVKFKVIINDTPTAIVDLCTLLISLGVSIKDIFHERAWIKDVFSVNVKVNCETRDWSHAEILKTALLEIYTEINFNDEKFTNQA